MHVIARSLSLVALGLLIANASQFDPQLSHMNPRLWGMLVFAGIVLVWSAYPASGHRFLYRALKYGGLLLLSGLSVTFRRRTQGGQVAWLDFSYWEILGLIGWAYLAVSSIYIFFRKNVWALTASLAVLCTCNVFSTVGRMRWMDRMPSYVWPFEAGLSSITMAGVLAWLILLETNYARTFKAKASWALVYAAVLLSLARALAPLGVSKERDTPAWCLYCAGVNTLLFLALYWLCDAKHSTKWAGFVKPAGSNTLLTYVLPYVVYVTPGLNRVSAYGSEGWQGVMKAMIFTGCVLTMSAVLTRCRIRLQL